MIKNLILFSCLLLILNVSRAQAFESGNLAQSQVSVAGGIASPSGQTALYQNPAGLPLAASTRVVGTFGSPNSDFSSPYFGGDLVYGNGMVGLGAGITSSTTTPSQTNARYGLGVFAESLKTALGVNAVTPLSPSGTTTVNLGLLINAKGPERFGLTFRNIGTNLSEFGGGVDVDIAEGVAIVVDATVNNSFKYPAIKPALEIYNQKAALTVGYGFTADPNNVFSSQEIEQYFSVGGNVEVARNLSIEAYVKQVNYYNLSLVIKI